MIEQEMANQDLGSVGRRFTNPSGGRWFWLLLEVLEETMAGAPSHTHEDAAIEVEDVLAQADEALVLG
jgi:hypothetical protein